MAKYNTDVGIGETQANEMITPVQAPIAQPSPLSMAEALPGVVKAYDQSQLLQKEQGLSDAYAQITKLRKASAQGRITYQDARGRVVALMREQINAMPHRAQELRQHAADFFGAYGEGWGALNEMQDEKDAASLERGLFMAYAKNVQKDQGLFWPNITDGMKKDYAVRMQIKNAADQAENLKKMKAINQENGMEVANTIVMPFRMQMVDGISKVLNTYRMGEKTIGERLAGGESYTDIMGALAADDTARKDLEGKLSVQLDMAIEATGRLFDQQVQDLQAQGLHYDAKTVAEQRKAVLEPFTSVKESLKEGKDQSLLTRYVLQMQNQNKGTTEAYWLANPAASVAKNLGMLNDNVWQQYMTNPNTIAPEMRPILKKLADQQMTMADWDRNLRHLAYSPQDLAGYETSNPTMKKAIEYMAITDLGKIIRNGKFDNAQQKQWFYSSSFIYLNGTDTTNPNHLNDMKNKLLDPQYAKLFAQLPAEQQSELSDLVFTKLQRELVNPQYGPLAQVMKGVRSAGEKGRMQNVAVYYDEGDKKVKAMSVSSDPYSTAKPEAFMEAEMKQMNDYIDLIAATYPMKSREGDVRKRIVEQILSGMGVLGNTDWTPEQGLGKLQSAKPLTEGD